MPTSFKFIGIGALLTLIGFIFVQEDLRLKIWGKPVVADVLHQDERSTRRSKQPSSYSLTYRFVDDKNEVITGGGKVPLDYKGASQSTTDEYGGPQILTVNVVYLPGKSSINRLATEGAFKSYLMFFGGMGMLLFGVFVFKNESVVDAHRQTNEDLENAGKSKAHRVLNRLAGD